MFCAAALQQKLFCFLPSYAVFRAIAPAAWRCSRRSAAPRHLTWNKTSELAFVVEDHRTLGGGYAALAILIGNLRWHRDRDARRGANYPWCAAYSGGDTGGGGTNCGFTTFQQCLETVRGIGGFCEQNTQYQPPPGPHQSSKT